MKAYERIQKKFREGCARYRLLEDGDRVLLALSGGKDSLLLAKLLAEQARIHVPHIEVEAAHVVMDNIPYETERRFLQHFCDDIGLPLNIIHSRFDETTDTRKTKCFLCSWYRRKALFNHAAEHQFSKLALGHHQDDIITTWLMNLTYTGSLDIMEPKVIMRNYPLQIIRPLCLVHEAWIAEVAAEEQFEKQKVPCPYETASRRADVAQLFHQLEDSNPEARYSLWRAMSKLHGDASL